MDKVLVTNLTYVTQHVGVVHADGTPDSVQIMPRKGRVPLRDGMTVCKRWLGLNPNVIAVVNPQPVLKAPTVTKGAAK